MIYQSLPKTIMIPKNFEYMTKIPIELFENIAQKKNDYHLKLSNKFRWFFNKCKSMLVHNRNTFYFKKNLCNTTPINK